MKRLQLCERRSLLVNVSLRKKGRPLGCRAGPCVGPGVEVHDRQVSLGHRILSCALGRQIRTGKSASIRRSLAATCLENALVVEVNVKIVSCWPAILPLLLRMVSENDFRLARKPGVERIAQIGHFRRYADNSCNGVNATQQTFLPAGLPSNLSCGA